MRKGDRPVSKHIVAFLEQHKGIGYRIADLIKEMSEQGWRHGDNAVGDNCKLLVKQNMIMKRNYFWYGIPNDGEITVPELLESEQENEVIQQLAHNYLAFYDNVSYIPKWLSDLFCRAQSGMGHSKRALFTNDDDVIYNLKRCIGLNGINVVASSGDLLDRCIMFELGHITDTARCTEQELVNNFNEQKSRILGAMLSLLSKSLKNYSTLSHDPLRRLADFHRWGCAISKALGYTSEEFNVAYSIKIEMQDEEALNASLTATALIGYCLEAAYRLNKKGEDFTCEKDEDGHVIIKVTPTKLYEEVTAYAKGKGIKTTKRYWAASANSFMRKVNEVKPNLSRVGCGIVSEHDGAKRWAIIDVTELIRKKGHEPVDIFAKIEEERRKNSQK